MKGPHSKSDDDLQSMMDELNAMVEGNKDVIEEAKEELGKPMGIMTIREALDSEDPLSNIIGELSGFTRERKVFETVYAGLLEINSAGVAILWDRLTLAEVDRLAGHLKEIGANQTYKALKEIRRFIVSRLGDPPDDDDLFELVGSEEFENQSRPYDVQFETLVREIEDKLMDYAKENVESLEESPPQKMK
jgi:hypothetical protein